MNKSLGYPTYNFVSELPAFARTDPAKPYRAEVQSSSGAVRRRHFGDRETATAWARLQAQSMLESWQWEPDQR